MLHLSFQDELSQPPRPTFQWPSPTPHGTMPIMAVQQTVTLDLPKAVYQQVKRRADAEAGELAKLMAHYERIMLVRAQAAATLKQRGHEVTVS